MVGGAEEFRPLARISLFMKQGVESLILRESLKEMMNSAESGRSWMSKLLIT